MLKCYFLTLTLALSNVAFAADTKTTASTPAPAPTTVESQTKVKLGDVSPRRNKVSGDIDEEITNARLRADSGSKSKFSLSFKPAYTGGSLQQPFGEYRPRLSADPGVQAFTSFDLGLNGRYRWTKNDSLTFGTAFGIVTPFQGRVGYSDKAKTKKNDAVNVNDPSIGYSRVAKIGAGLQTVGSIAYAYGTSINSRAIDLTHQVGLSYNMMRSFGRLSAGASVSTSFSLYSTDPGKNAAQASKSYGGDRRTQYTLGIFPQAEYAFSDRLSARTVFGYFNWMHLYGDTKTARLLQTYVYQSVGVGISVTRDFYLYPNIQFVPDNIRSDFTNVALSASINVF